MPNFPGSVYSPASKSAGQVITAAFFNDPNDEIVAIEGGYLNATARLNSSASTLASLSVTGGSTLAGTLQSSNSTLNALQVSSNSTFAIRPTMGPPDFISVYIDSTVTIGSSVLSTITWTARLFAINSSMHSTATNPSRLIPQSTGLYQISAGIRFGTGNASSQTASSDLRGLRIEDSSASLLTISREFASTNDCAVYGTGYKYFDALGGYVSIVSLSQGQSTISLTSGVGMTWASLLKV